MQISSWCFYVNSGVVTGENIIFGKIVINNLIAHVVAFAIITIF